MGCCLSKNEPICSSPPVYSPNPDPKPKEVVEVEQKVKKTGANELDKKEEVVEKEEEKQVVKKKEVFVIQHRKSNEKRPDSDGSVSNSTNSSDPFQETGLAADPSGGIGSKMMNVRTSSCTKEEVDAILIQCGRLSRSSSGVGNEKRYSGSKRSFDFEKEGELRIDGGGDGEDERLRRRQSRGSNRRRSTPSRSRERVEKEQQQQRSGGSRERGDQRSSGRRVSRSPQRRSESPMPNNGNGNGNVRPGKLVSVPATVSSLSNDKTNNVNNGNGGDSGNVKRVLVKRNIGSPRSQSPARTNQIQGSTQQPPSLSRNGSRKAEQSPYRRTPLNDIDTNSLPFQPLANKRLPNKGKEIEEDVVLVKQPLNSASQNKYSEANNVKGTHRSSSSRGAEGYEISKTNYCRVNELQTPIVEQMTEHKLEPVSPNGYDAMVTPVIVSGNETLKLPQTLMRSRSSRRSRDLDINVDALLTTNPATNYTSLLLQDIQNFHSSNSNGNASKSNSTGTPYTLPPCVSKACSILEAVADLNSCNGLADDRRISPRATAETAACRNSTNFSNHHDMKKFDGREPFLESEVTVGDDLMEPSLHKYVTVKRGGDLEDEESSGSNSFMGGSQQNWVSSSSWEPNSADSTDCWTSKSYSREDGYSPVGFQRHAMSDFAGYEIEEEDERKFTKNEMGKYDHPQRGAARAKVAVSRGPVQASKAAAASM